MNTVLVHTLAALLVGLLLKCTLLLLAAWALCRLGRRASAAARHLLWSAALGGILVLPLLTPALPHWNLAWRQAAAVPTAARPTPTRTPGALTPAPAPAEAPTVVAITPPLSPPTTPFAAPSDVAPIESPLTVPMTVPTPRRSRPPYPASASTVVWPVVWAVTALAVWILGCVAVLARLFLGLRRVAMIRRQAFPLDDAAGSLAESLREGFGLRRPIAFLRAAPGSGITLPLTWGGLSPTVLLPEQSPGWSNDNLRAALLHELAHVGRWDWTTQMLGRLACAVYWFHPLVWKAAREARAESERACDDCVLRAGLTAADYAQRLVDVVRSMPDKAPARTVAIAMAQPSEVEGRLRALFAQGCNRGPLTRRRALATLAAVAFLVLPLSALRLVARAALPAPPNTSGAALLKETPMKKTLIAPAIALLGLSAVTAPAAPKQAPPAKQARLVAPTPAAASSLTPAQAKAAIQQVCNRISDAINIPSQFAMPAFFAPEFRMISPDGTVHSQADLASELGNLSNQLDVQTYVLQIAVTGNTATTIVSQSLGEGPSGATARLTWRKTRGGWLLTRIDNYKNVGGSTVPGPLVVPFLSKAQDKTTIQAVCDQMDAAMNQRNLEATVAFLAPEFFRHAADNDLDVDMVGFTAALQRRFALPEAINARTQVLQATRRENQITALVTQTINAEGPDGVKPHRYTMSQTWNLTGGKWVLIAIDDYTEVTDNLPSRTVTAPSSPVARSLTAAQVKTAVAALRPVAYAAIPQASADTDPSVTAAQEHLRRVTLGVKAGINSPADIDEATIVLAEARIRAALAQNQPRDIPQNLAVIVAQRQALLKRAETRNKAGIGSIAEVNQAQTDLAQAQARSSLYTIVMLRAQGLARANHLRAMGAESVQESEEAATALQKAQRLFAESSD